MMTNSKRRKAKDARLRKEFDITLAFHDEVLKYQKGACAICQKKLNKKGLPLILSVDHDHTTGEVRGLLCWPCNKLIAIALDDANRLKRAGEYLQMPPVYIVNNGKSVFTAPGRVGSKKRNKLLAKMKTEGSNVEKKQKMGKK